MAPDRWRYQVIVNHTIIYSVERDELSARMAAAMAHQLHPEAHIEIKRKLER